VTILTRFADGKSLPAPSQKRYGLFGHYSGVFGRVNHPVHLPALLAGEKGPRVKASPETIEKDHPHPRGENPSFWSSSPVIAGPSPPAGVGEAKTGGPSAAASFHL
jgi:hypothetical protein